MSEITRPLVVPGDNRGPDVGDHPPARRPRATKGAVRREITGPLSPRAAGGPRRPRSPPACLPTSALPGEQRGGWLDGRRADAMSSRAAEGDRRGRSGADGAEPHSSAVFPSLPLLFADRSGITSGGAQVGPAPRHHGASLRKIPRGSRSQPDVKVPPSGGSCGVDVDRRASTGRHLRDAAALRSVPRRRVGRIFEMPRG